MNEKSKRGRHPNETKFKLLARATISALTKNGKVIECSSTKLDQIR